MRKVAVALVSLALSGAVVPVGATLIAAPAAADSSDPTVVGAFGAPFEQPEGHNCENAQDPSPQCKPAAMAVAALSNGKLLYWDGLEGMNHVQYNVVAEFGGVAQNDQSRVMTLLNGASAATNWTNPTPEDANVSKSETELLLPSQLADDSNTQNDADLFCSALVQLPDGRVMEAGGTGYYLEPGAEVNGKGYGVSELQGLKATRIFDPATNAWTNATGGDMNYGRWYPTLVTLPSGKVFVASGVTKLVKPVYNDGRPPEDNLRNVVETETWTNGKGWTVNPATANKSLPLFPRLHLLPDGKVYYDAAGQTFNPFGQAYDEASWVNASVYDPSAQTWTDLGMPTIGGLPLGFRGSAFDVMLPLQPDANGAYTKARILSAGGVIGPTPGSYVANAFTTLNTVDTSGGKDVLTSENVGQLNQARWYGSGVVLPTGQVFLVNGADRDEVDVPGSGTPIKQGELFDPTTKTWTPVASESHGRTYHNTAVLLPDGRVLVGGHAPIATGYAFQTDVFAQTLGLSRPEGDPSFEIYSPPYMFWPGRPSILENDQTVNWGQQLTVTLDDSSDVTRLVLVRNPSYTHLVDGDQRAVDLPVQAVDGTEVRANVPGASVLPPGPYWLFAIRHTDKGDVPSVAKQVFVRAPETPVATPLAVAGGSSPATQPASGRAAAAAATGTAAGAAAPGARVPASALVARRASAIADNRRTPWPVLPAVVGGLLAGAGLVVRRRMLRR